MAYQNGFTASGMLLIYGDDCVKKARACGEMIRKRVERAGYSLATFNVECLGAGEGVPGTKLELAAGGEAVMRVTASDLSHAAVERFTKEFAPLVTSGPPGIAGYASGRPQVRHVFAYWPTLVPKTLVKATVEVRTAKEWGIE